jgi:flagellar biosynthesis anti-sigma factor FlgM
MVKVNTNDIHGNNAVHGAKTHHAGKGAPVRSVPTKDLKASLGSDTVSFSGKGAEVGKLVDQIRSLPDVRQDRVAELKAQVDGGEYDPSSDTIAAAIMKDEQ